MRLISIKLAGFKSFVDPTHLSFQSNLTAIVGPNGCGKSNIVDAIYCVLGSNSKSLRAGQMADVIFNGTTTRQPVAQASIELVFENADARIGGEYAKYPEISIRRELNRDGQSNYLLNGVRCRRKDITDIFLGTGLGNNSYAIIEQGMISRLIEAKPEELRAHVEEAAGTSKYKERRRETENRIKHTRENLDRLNDLREEQAKQLSHLQRQANAAERYKILKAEQRLVKAQLHAILWQGLNEKVAVIDQKIQFEETAFEAKMAELRQVDKEIEYNRSLRIEKNDVLNDVQSQYYSLGAEISRVEQQINHAKERKKQLENDFQRVQEAYEEQKQQLFEDQSQLQELTQEASQVEDQLVDFKQQAEQEKSHLHIAEERMHAWQEQWDELNRICANASKQMEVEKTKIQHLEQKQQTLLSRIDRIEDEQSSQESTSQAQEVIDLRGQQKDCQFQLEALQERLETIQETIQLYRGDQAVAQQEVALLTKELRGLQAQHASLQAMQQIALGKSNTGISNWLIHHQLDNKKRLAEGLEVEAGWEIAVETVLADHLDAICVPDFIQYIDAVGEITEADITFFKSKAAEEGEASHKGIAPLKEKVISHWPTASLLDTIYVTETLPEGLDKLHLLAPHESIVTRDGIWFSHSWLRVTKAKKEKSGVLQREHDLKELHLKINEQQAVLAKKEAFVHDIDEKLNHTLENREQVQQELQILRAKNSDLLAQINAKESLIQQLQQKNERLINELSECQEQLQEVEINLDTARTTLISVSRSAEEEENKRLTLLTQKDELRGQLDQVRREASACRQTVDESQVRFESIRNQIHYLNQNISRVERQLTATAERKNQLEVDLNNITDPMPELSLELQQTLEKRALIEDDLSVARQALDALDTNLKQLEKNRHDFEQNTQDIRSLLEQARIESQALRVKMTTYVEQIQEASFNLEEIKNALSTEARASDWEENLLRIENRIQRLGPINLAAIEEYAALAERKAYLDQQHDDLIEALETLENAIRKIDKETRVRFKETFTKLNESFRTYFKEVFNGGEANLELTSDDFLETGVIVKAQPPGKRNTTIHLLSGGEKALTAISLVFAIFSLNPAPFCVLDEVDAPLDDANVGRFCHLVKKMSEKIQFIFISHNKLAIEMGQQLAGVTMHEPGVSRLVSVDVEQAITMATE